MAASLLKMAALDRAVTGDTTLFRRHKTLAVQIPCRLATGPLNLLVDNAGIKLLGDGEGAGPHAWHSGPPPRAQRPLGRADSHFGHPGGGIHPSSDGDSPVSANGCDHAIWLAATAGALAPDFTPCLRYLAALCLRKGDFETARAAARRLCGIVSDRQLRKIT